MNAVLLLEGWIYHCAVYVRGIWRG